jgi:D-glycero-D-manno-heptose 1,7-bisphosphate phosphatase
MTNQIKNKALFLDRDGVINIEKNYLYQIKDFKFIHGVIDCCREMQLLGYLIVIITNQSGIARGKYSEHDYQKLTQWMLSYFQSQNINISAVYHCPHHPDISGQCDCRKPAPGLINKACETFNIDASQSILVGDKNSDIEAGINAGVGQNYLAATGHLIKENRYRVKILDNLKDLLNYAPHH